MWKCACSLYFYLLKNLIWHRSTLGKTENDVVGTGQMDDFPEFWADIVVNWNLGLQRNICTLHPTTNLNRKSLRSSEDLYIDRITNYSVILENCIWCETKLKIMVEEPLQNEARYDNTTKLLVSLRNIDDTLCPTRLEDGNAYKL